MVSIPIEPTEDEAALGALVPDQLNAGDAEFDELASEILEKNRELYSRLASAGHMSIRARVTQGRLVIDEPVDLPEGTVLELVVDDEGEELDEDERWALHARLAASAGQAAGGGSRSLTEILSGRRSGR